jgi:N-acetylneuraminate synthase
MSTLFLVPARGGSKGLSGKNLSLLGGIPLVARAVRTALRAARHLEGPSRVVCSTDDPAIASTAREWGAEVPFVRPAELATDEARTLDVARHALAALDGEFTAVVLLQPTSPLTEPQDVVGALRLFRASGGPVASVCAAEHPPEWHHRLAEDGRLAPVLPDVSLSRRQDAGPSFRPNGAIYVAAPAQVHGDGFWARETRGSVMPPERSVDVDSAADLEVARALLAARPVPEIEIAGRKIGPGHPCFVIAEAGVNHNGSVDTALRLVDAAARAGADAVKFQTFRAERLATPDAPKAGYQVRATGEEESQYQMLKRLELDEAAHEALVARCRERGILFLSSPFDEECCDFLEALGVPAFKVPSGELANLPFLRHVAAKGRPMILSTGMATLLEVSRAVDAVESAGCPPLVLLHCVSSYPAEPAEANLRAMGTMRAAFGVPAGFSDHTEGDVVPLAAVAMGAAVVEKHFTLDRSLPGPDHQASIEPPALARLVSSIRRVEAALGDGLKRPVPSEEDTARVARKSLVALRAIAAGEPLDPRAVGARRPGTGIAPERLAELLGKRARQDVAEGTVLAVEMFE